MRSMLLAPLCVCAALLSACLLTGCVEPTEDGPASPANSASAGLGTPVIDPAAAGNDSADARKEVEAAGGKILAEDEDAAADVGEPEPKSVFRSLFNAVSSGAMRAATEDGGDGTETADVETGSEARENLP